MKRAVGLITALLAVLVLAPISGCSSQQGATATTRKVTDPAGRTVEIPTTVDKVYSAVPTAEAMIYSLAPEKLVGWVNKPNDKQKGMLTESTRNLPVLGGWMGEKSTANMEEIIKRSPDLIVFMTTGGINSNGKQLGDSIQQQTGRPVVVLDSALDRTAETYRLLGDWLGVKDRAEELAKYTETTLADVKAKVSTIADGQRVGVYYAESATGLATDPTGSAHTEVLDFVRARNVADVQMKGGQGMTPISMEQVLRWNPDVVLVSTWSGGADAFTKIKTDPSWAKVKAVSDGRVYQTPSLPFTWFDRPPSATRVLGVQWAANLLYPQAVPLDITQRTREFYKLFYRIDLTDAQLSAVTAGAVPAA